MLRNQLPDSGNAVRLKLAEFVYQLKFQFRNNVCDFGCQEYQSHQFVS